MKTLFLTLTVFLTFYSYSFSGGGENTNSCPCSKTKTRKIVEIQKGVSHGNESGVYIYYVDRSNSKFNPTKDRKFLSNEEMLKLRINK